jgi:hypothetical protein
MGDAEHAMDRLSTQTIRGAPVTVTIDDVSSENQTYTFATFIYRQFYSLVVPHLPVTTVAEVEVTILDLLTTTVVDPPLVGTMASEGTTTVSVTGITVTVPLLVVEETGTGLLPLPETVITTVGDLPLPGRETTLPGVAMTASKCEIFRSLR